MFINLLKMNTTLNLGKVFASSNISRINHFDFVDFINNCIDRHKKADFGDIEQEDKESNLYALEKEGRVLSVYNLPDTLVNKLELLNDRIWIITEWDRSSTTVLFPSEY